MSRRILGSIVIALQAAIATTFMGTAPARAESLETYYKVLIAVRKCELSVDEVQLSKLQDIIETRVTNTDASSDTINDIFDNIAADIGDDTPAFCTAYTDTALSVLENL
ncbi:hypothetical protein [Taklimakanibacter lacteus]|uniref:hypothetical protein n=1 Tax=Taklimakanibacter lacteus TaxID=2268456 RepID=UPI0013C4DAC5